MNPASLPPGTEVGPWHVVEQRGRGAYGVVYRVERAGGADATPFALKLALHPLDPRFEREGELLSRIRHAHVPRLQDRGWWVSPGGVPFPYLVMDWIEGVPLYEWGAQHPLTSRQALQLLAQVARALEAMHAVDGVHRDVKGGNILVREDGTAVLMDFGSGDYLGARTLMHQLPPPGTPQYQSPESLRFQWQWRASRTARYEARPTDDVYSLGVTAYRLVTGRYPPPAVELEETEKGARLIHAERMPPEAWVSLCSELAALIHQMLSPEPSDRGSAGAMAQALEAAAKNAGPAANQPITPLPAQAPTASTGRPVPSRPSVPWPPWLAAATCVALTVGAWWIGQQPSVERPAGTSPTARNSSEEPVGLAETVLSIPVSMAPPEPTRDGIGLDMPQKPFPGQRRAPCEKPEVEINGGCWVGLRDATPPCGARSYEWKHGCYLPMFDPPRPATTDQP